MEESDNFTKVRCEATGFHNVLKILISSFLVCTCTIHKKRKLHTQYVCMYIF